MGSLLGLFVGIGLLFGAWDGTIESWGLGAFLVAGLLGIVLIPMTVGTFMTSIMMIAPIAALLALLRGNMESAGVSFGIAIGAFITQWIVGALRRGSIY